MPNKQWTFVKKSFGVLNVAKLVRPNSQNNVLEVSSEHSGSDDNSDNDSKQKSSKSFKTRREVAKQQRKKTKTDGKIREVKQAKPGKLSANAALQRAGEKEKEKRKNENSYLCKVLGMDTKGMCLRHPNQKVTSLGLTFEAVNCCRICDSESQMGTKQTRPLPAMANVISQVQKMQEDRETWRQRTKVLYYNDTEDLSIDDVSDPQNDLLKEFSISQEAWKEQVAVRVNQVLAWQEHTQLQNHAVFGKYFKMLEMGVPMEAAKNACDMDGYPSVVLDLDPAKPLKAQTGQLKKKDRDEVERVIKASPKQKVPGDDENGEDDEEVPDIVEKARTSYHKQKAKKILKTVSKLDALEERAKRKEESRGRSSSLAKDDDVPDGADGGSKKNKSSMNKKASGAVAPAKKIKTKTEEPSGTDMTEKKKVKKHPPKKHPPTKGVKRPVVVKKKQPVAPNTTKEKTEQTNPKLKLKSRLITKNGRLTKPRGAAKDKAKSLGTISEGIEEDNVDEESAKSKLEELTRALAQKDTEIATLQRLLSQKDAIIQHLSRQVALAQRSTRGTPETSAGTEQPALPTHGSSEHAVIARSDGEESTEERDEEETDDDGGSINDIEVPNDTGPMLPRSLLTVNDSNHAVVELMESSNDDLPTEFDGSGSMEFAESTEVGTSDGAESPKLLVRRGEDVIEVKMPNTDYVCAIHKMDPSKPDLGSPTPTLSASNMLATAKSDPELLTPAFGDDNDDLMDDAQELVSDDAEELPGDGDDHHSRSTSEPNTSLHSDNDGVTKMPQTPNRHTDDSGRFSLQGKTASRSRRSTDDEDTFAYDSADVAEFSDDESSSEGGDHQKQADIDQHATSSKKKAPTNESESLGGHSLNSEKESTSSEKSENLDDEDEGQDHSNVSESDDAYLSETEDDEEDEVDDVLIAKLQQEVSEGKKRVNELKAIIAVDESNGEASSDDGGDYEDSNGDDSSYVGDGDEHEDGSSDESECEDW